MSNKEWDEAFDTALMELDASGIFKPYPLGIKESGERLRRGSDIAFRRLLARRRLACLVEWFVDQWDAGGGDEYLMQLTQKLCENHDTRFLNKLWRKIANRKEESDRKEDIRLLKRLWRGAIANRKDVRKRGEVLWAFRGFSQAMARIGETAEAQAILEEMELFRQGKRKEPPPITDHRKMDEDLFWTLLDEARASAENSADLAERLCTALTQFRPPAIRRFDSMFRKKMAESFRWDVWALAYIARGGCGDDEFDYFRAWLIAQGREAYAAVINDVHNAGSLNLNSDLQCEPLIYAAMTAFETRTGEALPPRSAPRLKGKAWDEQDLPGRYPELCRLFNWPGA